MKYSHCFNAKVRLSSEEKEKALHMKPAVKIQYHK